MNNDEAILLFIALPLPSHVAINIVWPVGLTHGILWLTCVVTSLVVSHRQKWSVLFWLLILVISVTPFAFVYLDRKLIAEVTRQLDN